MNLRSVAAAFGVWLAGGVYGQDLTWSGPDWAVAEDAPDQLPQPKRLREPAMPRPLADYGSPVYAEYRLMIRTTGPRLLAAFHSPIPWLESEMLVNADFAPAKRDGKPVDSEIVLHLIYNPHTAQTKSADATPRLLRVVPPVYPDLSKDASAGPRAIMVEAVIGASGAVKSAAPVAEVEQPFAAAAVASVRQWGFAPARRGGQPVEATVQVPVVFLPAADVDAPRLSVQPKPIFQAKPVYPFPMRAAGIHGEVLIGFVIGVEGRVREAFVIRSSHPGFDESAVEAVEKWRFEPGRVNERPVNVRMQVPIVFSLDPGGQEGFRVKRPKSFPPDLPEAFHFEHPPEMVGFAVPNYPLEALRAKTGGKVKIGFVVGPDGSVHRADLIGEPPTPEIGAAAVAAVEAFKFKPAAKGGVPCFAMLVFEFEFVRNGTGSVPVSPEAQRVLRLLDHSPEKLVSLADLDAPPRPRGRKPPVVPAKFRHEPRAGEALIEFVIDRKGFARLPRIVSASVAFRTAAPARQGRRRAG
jgi:TonB family protein